MKNSISKIFEDFRQLCGNKEIVIKHNFTRDCGHGDLVETNFVMLTFDGNEAYYIGEDGKFNENCIGYECALLYVDTPIEDMLIELYDEIKIRLKQ